MFWGLSRLTVILKRDVVVECFKCFFFSGRNPREIFHNLGKLNRNYQEQQNTLFVTAFQNNSYDHFFLSWFCKSKASLIYEDPSQHWQIPSPKLCVLHPKQVIMLILTKFMVKHLCSKLWLIFYICVKCKHFGMLFLWVKYNHLKFLSGLYHLSVCCSALPKTLFPSASFCSSWLAAVALMQSTSVVRKKNSCLNVL